MNFKQPLKIISSLNFKQSLTILNHLKPAVLLVAIFAAACGSNAGVNNPTGPDFDVAELKTIRVDQLKISGGLEDDEDGAPEIAVYLRCADTDKDVLCAGADQGLDLITKDSMLYGRLDANFVDIEEASIFKCFDVKLVVVEKDSNNCPSPINADDDVLFESPVLTLNEDGSGTLLKNKISNEGGSVSAYLIGPADDLTTSNELGQTPVNESRLVLDQLYFRNPEIFGKVANFKLSAKIDEVTCSVSFASGDTGILQADVIYGNLGLDLSLDNENTCLISDEQMDLPVTIVLNIGVDGITTKLQSAEDLLLKDLIDDGEKVKLGKGEAAFIAFAPIKIED